MADLKPKLGIGRDVPFRVTADIPLPDGLAPWVHPSLGGGDVTIRRGFVPDSLPASEAEDPGSSYARNRTLISLPGDIRFLVEGGSTVRYAAPGNTPPTDISVFLLGPVWSALSLQRGLLPLHAGAVALGTDVYAFAGVPGQGKSTLASALSRRGYAFFGDDLLLLDASSGRNAQCFGRKDLKLWGSAIAMTGARAGGLVRPGTGLDKRYASVPNVTSGNSGTLRSLYRLTSFDLAAAGDSACRINRLVARRKVEGILRSVYRRRQAVHIVGGHRLFQWVSELAKHIDVFEFCRPRLAEKVHEGVDFLTGELPDPRAISPGAP